MAGGGIPTNTGKNAHLDACYGAGHAASMPASFDLYLFDRHPDFGGVELAHSGGYDNVLIPNDGTGFLDATGGVKRSTLIDLPDATGPWSDVAQWWEIRHAGVRYYTGKLSRRLNVQDAGPVGSIQLAIFYTRNES